MSIYVSAGANLLVQIRGAKSVLTAAGETVQTVTRLKAQFQPGNPGDWAIPQVTAKLPMGIVPDGVNPSRRLGVFDTDVAQESYGWTNDERKIVENFLDTNQGPEMGFVKVERPLVDAPWPAIEKLRPHGRRTNEISAEKLVDAADTFGVDPDDLIPYLEQERWPAEVIGLVKEKAAAQVPDEPVEELVEA